MDQSGFCIWEASSPGRLSSAAFNGGKEGGELALGTPVLCTSKRCRCRGSGGAEYRIFPNPRLKAAAGVSPTPPFYLFILFFTGTAFDAVCLRSQASPKVAKTFLVCHMYRPEA